MNKCVFLDRDGTINIDTGYPYKLSQLEIIPGVPDAIAKIKEKGYLAIVLTNQSGVARGLYSLADVDNFNQRINEILYQSAHIMIDAFYVCPHYPDGIVAEFSHECNCRKPKTGLVYKAQHDYSIDLASSYMIGDKESDLRLAVNAGLKGAFMVGNMKNINDCIEMID